VFEVRLIDPVDQLGGRRSHPAPGEGALVPAEPGRLARLVQEPLTLLIREGGPRERRAFSAGPVTWGRVRMVFLILVGKTNVLDRWPDQQRRDVNERLFTELPSWLLDRAALRSHRLLQSRLAAHGATGHEYRVLSVLSTGPHTQAGLGRKTSLDRRDVTEVVTRLEGCGYVARAQSPTDARALVVSVTTAGRQRTRLLGRVMESVQEDLLRDLGAGERELFVMLLTRIGAPAG